MNVYVLVEYDEQGNEAGIVPIAAGTDVTELQIVGAHDYRAEHAKLAAAPIPMYSVDFKVDVMYLTGLVQIRNP